MSTSEYIATELALRRHVERAVRPVTASEARKMRMREELLAHLMAIYQDELERGDPAAAVVAACQRFGAPAELTVELDRSVGQAERWGCAIDNTLAGLIRRAVQLRPGEPLWRGGLRVLAWLAAANAAFIVSVTGLSILFHGWPDDPTSLPLLPKALGLLVAAQWLAVVAAQVTERALLHRRGWRVWLGLTFQSLGWALLVLLFAMAFWWSITWELLEASAFFRLARSIFAVVPALLMLTAWLAQVDRRRRAQQEAWTLLPLDD